VTLADFRAMSLEELTTWLQSTNDALVGLQFTIDSLSQKRTLAYRVLKEKMAR
jgi:hypothetical protein